MCELPVADWPGIHMQAVLTRIVAYSTSLQRHCSLAYQGSIAPRETDIDGFPLDMQALHSHHPIRAAELRIGGRGTISGEHMKGRVSLEQLAQSVEKIKQRGINSFHLIGVIIAQEIGNLLQRMRHILTAAPIDRSELFSGVDSIDDYELFDWYPSVHVGQALPTASMSQGLSPVRTGRSRSTA